ncbi:MerR family transcriptional regulator [uncultured Vagococcus sp.]|uniref:MerR family transcriptional regulator n=1 Tax=uncultured Vagococcus sp. TaxID=189676 RepID=UPI0028D0E172|nr:MerR family transcriptional regulator [uncultured Vagococcus sp.]
MYTIKEFAKRLKVKVSTIRYYERAGLLRPKRGENDYRLYSSDDLERARYILVMKYAAFSIEEIKQMLEMMVLPTTPDCEARSEQLLTAKERELEHKIARYQEVLSLLTRIKPLAIEANYEEVEPEIAATINDIYQKINEEQK